MRIPRSARRPHARLPTLFLAAAALLPATPAETSPPEADCSSLLSLDDWCEEWAVDVPYGDSCCYFSRVDAAEHLIATPDRVFATVPINDPGRPVLDERWDWQTTAFSPSDGRELWTRRVGGPAWDIPISLVAAPSGTLYVTGYRDYPKSPNEINLSQCAEDFAPASAMTIAYDMSSGQELWRSGMVDPPSLDAAFDSVLSPDGRLLYTAGVRRGVWDDRCDVDYAVAALDARTGEELWSTFLEGEPHGFDVAYGIELAPDGERLVLFGRMENFFTRADLLTVGIDVPTEAELEEGASGRVAWTATYDGGVQGNDFPTDLVMDPTGQAVYVTGESRRGEPGAIFASATYETLAYDVSSGSRLWSSRYATLVPGWNNPNSIGVSRDGYVFVTGQSVGVVDGEWDIGTVAYGAGDGGTLWSRRYMGPAFEFEEAVDLEISPDGQHVFVTGQMNDATGVPGRHAVTLAYGKKTGDVAAVARFPGIRQWEVASGVAMAVAGERVFVLAEMNDNWTTTTPHGPPPDARRAALISYKVPGP